MVCISANLLDMGRVEVKYITLDGWQSSVTNVRQFSELPKNAQKYIQTIEHLVEVPVKWVGVGPKRESIIQLF